MPDSPYPGFVVWLCGSAAYDLRLSLFDGLRARLAQRGIAPSLFVLDNQAERLIEVARSAGCRVTATPAVLRLLRDGTRHALVLGDCAVGHRGSPEQPGRIRLMSVCALPVSDYEATEGTNPPSLTVLPGTHPVADELNRILIWLADVCWIASEQVPMPEDEEMLLRRLQDLGYI